MKMEITETKITEDITKYKTPIFNVYNLNDNYSFIHVDIEDNRKFMKEFCNYLLDHTNLLRYINNNIEIKFTSTKENMVQLYKRINLFIDDENIIEHTSDAEIKDILKSEGVFIREDEKKIEVRLSKIGRMGEYIFHLILTDFFKFDCIIPKISLTTDKNQSVFGIDELFLCKDKNMLLFGESKVTKKLEYGITLLKKSLSKYEQEIKEEYLLVLSNDNLKLKHFEDLFGNAHKVCVNFEDFVKKAGITKIGIPLFIAHGEDNDPQKILETLKRRIDRANLFGLETHYYVISLPILDKKQFVDYVTDELSKKLIELGK